MAVETRPANRQPRIDFHAHLLERRAAAEGAPHSVVTGFGARTLDGDGGTALAAVQRDTFDPARHVEMLDRLGLDAEVVSSMGVMQPTAWADPALEHELVAGINDEIARWVASHPTRIIGSSTLPLLDPARALDELDRCVSELQFRVVALPAAVGGVYLSEPPFHYLWDVIAHHDLVAFVHPDGVRDPWFQRYSMWNSVGQPIEEAKFIASLIYEGILERLPELKIVVAHGGGYLPHYFGRLDRNATAWPASMKNLSRKPSGYLRNLYYDTCLYEPAMLEALVGRVGADRIVMGSDFPVGDADPVGFIERCSALGESEKLDVVGGTAARLLGVVAGEGLGVVNTAREPSFPRKERVG